MPRSLGWGLMAQMVIVGVNCQNSSSKTCADIESNVQYNSSTSRKFRALKLEQGPHEDRFAIHPDFSRSWNLSYHVQQQPVDTSYEWRPDNNYYYGTMLLDTRDSNITSIGSCHQTLQAEVASEGYYTMSKEVLERSERDEGDCRILLGDDCVNALRDQSREEAAEWSMRSARCADMETSLPQNCSGLGLRRAMLTRETRLTYFNTRASGYPNSQFDPSLKCNGVNASSTHMQTVTEGMNYGPAVQFPIVDIITFWPNRLDGLENYRSFWSADVHVEVVCMRPTTVADGSTKPPSPQELLNDESANFPRNQTETKPSGAKSVTHGALGLMSACIMGVMLLL